MCIHNRVGAGNNTRLHHFQPADDDRCQFNFNQPPPHFFFSLWCHRLTPLLRRSESKQNMFLLCTNLLSSYPIAIADVQHWPTSCCPLRAQDICWETQSFAICTVLNMHLQALQCSSGRVVLALINIFVLSWRTVAQVANLQPESVVPSTRQRCRFITMKFTLLLVMFVFPAHHEVQMSPLYPSSSKSAASERLGFVRSVERTLSAPWREISAGA